MELTLYRAIKTELQSEIPEIKTVGLYNNQFMHLLRDNTKQNPFLFPACFIQMKPYNFKDLSGGVQEFEMDLTTHLGFESHTDQDEEILEIKQRLYLVLQRFQSEYFARLSRTNEQPDFDFGNFQVYKTTYHTRGLDYGKDTRLGSQVYLGLGLTGQTAINLTGYTYNN